MGERDLSRNKGTNVDNSFIDRRIAELLRNGENDAARRLQEAALDKKSLSLLEKIRRAWESAWNESEPDVLQEKMRVMTALLTATVSEDGDCCDERIRQEVFVMERADFIRAVRDFVPADVHNRRGYVLALVERLTFELKKGEDKDGYDDGGK